MVNSYSISSSSSGKSIFDSHVLLFITASCYILVALFTVAWFVRYLRYLYLRSKKKSAEKKNLLPQEHTPSSHSVCTPLPFLPSFFWLFHCFLLSLRDANCGLYGSTRFCLLGHQCDVLIFSGWQLSRRNQKIVMPLTH